MVAPPARMLRAGGKARGSASGLRQRLAFGNPCQKKEARFSPGLSQARGAAGARPQFGWNTTLTQLSFLSRKVLYSSGPSSSFVERCVIRNVGSIVPSWISLASGSR